MRVAVLGGLAFVLFAIVFFRLWFLQVLSGEDYVSQARDNRVRKVRIEAPRGNIVDRHGTVLVKTRVAPVVQIVPSSLPESVLEQADEFRKVRGEAEKARLAAADQLRSLERDIRERRGGATRQQRRERRRLARSARQAAPVAVPPVPVGELELRRLYRRLGPRDRRPPEGDPRARDRGRRRAAVLERHDPHGGRSRRVQLHPRAQGGVPRRRGREAVPARLPARRARRPAVRDHARDLARGAQAEALPRRRARHADRGRRHRGELRRVPARHRRLHARGHQRARQPRRPPPDDAPRAASRASACGSRSTSTSSAPPTTRSPARSGAASQNGAKAGAFVAMDPRNGEILALGSYPSFDANEFAKPISQAPLQPALQRGARRAAVQPRDRRHLSDRLDLQADHGDGGARGGRDHAGRRRSSTTASSSSATACSRTPRTPCTGRSRSRAR